MKYKNFVLPLAVMMSTVGATPSPRPEDQAAWLLIATGHRSYLSFRQEQPEGAP